MKKATRLVALPAALLLLCLSATGCNAIDEMRARHGFYTENGNCITVDEVEYRLLPENEYFTPIRDSNGMDIYVTDKDVPVLLSAILGDGFNRYNNGLILSTNIYGEEQNYCRADKHDEIAAQMAGEFNPTGLCYTYSMLDTETELYQERGYLLTKEQSDAIDEVLNTVGCITRAENIKYTNDYRIELNACTDNMLLQDWMCNIEKTGNTYYIVIYDYAIDAEVEYTVPETLNATFHAIFKNKIDAEKAARQYYSDLYGYDYDDDIDIDIDYEMI